MHESVVDAILKSIPDDEILADSTQPWIKELLEAVNETIVELEIDSECLPLSTTGKALKEALKELPATRQVSILNDTVVSYGKRRRREEDRRAEEEHVQEMQVRQLKYNLIKYSAFGLLFLLAVFIVGVVVISFQQNTLPDTEIANGLLNTLLEVFKLIFAVS